MPFVQTRIWIPLLGGLMLVMMGPLASEATSASSSSSSSSSAKLPASSPPPPTTKSSTTTSRVSLRLPGRNFEDDDDDFSRKRRGWMTGLGREFDLFDTRGGQDTSSDSEEAAAAFDYDDVGHNDDDDEPELMAPWAMNAAATSAGKASAVPVANRQQQQQPQKPRNNIFPGSGGASGGGIGSKFKNRNANTNNNNNNSGRPAVVQSVQEWWTSNISPNVKNWPRIQCRVEPTTTLKIRKTFRPLKTIVRLGADFNTQLGVWQFKSSWEDAIIGGKITLAGKELQLSKSWQLSVGAVEDLVTRLRFRAAVDLQTWKAYARVGFRTERLSPINIMEGFTLLKQLPLDGNRGNVKLEVKANFALPEPEIEYSTESHRSLVGMGDIEVNIDELNLVLDY